MNCAHSIKSVKLFMRTDITGAEIVGQLCFIKIYSDPKRQSAVDVNFLARQLRSDSLSQLVCNGSATLITLSKKLAAKDKVIPIDDA